ncbi:hypothetical protein M5689_023925 [Euphorbia peplus]|nr:hypothetical protein M5689_023925 [Euphorbia peplus]
MAGDDDEGFGDFKFAPSSTTTVRFDPPIINGHVDNNDDDDWGDFIIPAGLSHAVSLPRFRLDRNDDSELRQPGSAPGPWKKPTGALPLSIFGEIEDERKSSARDPAFEIDSGNKVSGPNVNDLIADLLKRSDVVPNVSNSDDKMNISGSNLDVNVINVLKSDAVELSSRSRSSSPRVPDFSLNSNGSNSSKDVIKEGMSIANGDDGWEFKDAQASKTNVGEEISKMNPIKTENGAVVNSTWNSLSLNSNAWNSNFDIASSSSNFLDSGLVEQAGGHDSADDDDEDDDGWEFKVADSQTQLGDDKVCLNKNKHMEILNTDVLSSSWDIPSSNTSGLNSDEKQFNAANFIDEKMNSGVANVWAFNGAEPDLLATDDNPKIRTENVPASILSSDRGTSSDLTGVNLDTKQVNSNLFDKNEDFWGNDGWEFKTAGSVHGPEEEDTKDDRKMPKDFESTVHTFGFNNGVHSPGDLFGASQWTSHKLVESNSDFAFSSNKSEKNHTDSILPSSQDDNKLDSVENSWSSNVSFPEAVQKDEGDKVKLDNNKRALPLSIFGDEEVEEDNPVIHQDSSTSITSSTLRNAIKNHQIDINDLISSLYSQAAQNTSVNHEETLSGSGLDSTRNGGSNLVSDNHGFDDDTWEFQDASLGTGENGFAPIKEYSTKTEQDDCVELFSRLREELHYTALYHLENLKKSQTADALTGNGAKTQDLDKEIQDLESELQDSIISTAIFSESGSPRAISLDVFIEALLEPNFQVFGSEYQLAEKVSLAGSDWRSAIDVLKSVSLIVNILTSASREEQSSYISAWSKIVSVCAQELRHGTSIWKQAAQQNFQDQILSRPQGKNYVLALGEVYRVAKVLESSAKLYKPWILATSADSMRIFTLITDCSSLWSSSGLEEALYSSFSSDNFEADGRVKTLLESIKYIDALDVESLYDHVFSGQNPPCQLSALTADLVPGMKTVVWNGNHCFLTIANLWANMVSSEPPNWPCIHVG